MKKLIFVVVVLAASASVMQGQVVFKSGVDLVNFGVTVVDRKGSLITDLNANDFEIYEEGKKQTITYFGRGDGTDETLPPLHVGALFDTSGSMEQDMDLSRSAAIKFLNALMMAVDITLVDFDSEVRVARYAQADFPRLVERIRQRKSEGMTALYDALGVYLDGANGQDGRKVLVLYTDGGDSQSSMSYSDVLTLLKASDVTVYAVGFLEHQSSLTKMDQRSKLSQMSEVTGGQAFFPTTIKELDPVYDKVLQEIQAQYTLGYISADARTDGAWRKVDVKMVRGDLKGARVRARKGYFGPYKPAGNPPR